MNFTGLLHSIASNNTSSSNTVPLWLYFVLAIVPSIIAFSLYRIEVRRFQRERSTDIEQQAKARRELDRREDQLWGYIDSQGIRHIGVVDTVAVLKVDLDSFMEKFKKVIEEAHEPDS